MTTEKEKLNALIAHFAHGNGTEFARQLGVTQGCISGWQKRGTFDFKLIAEKFPSVSAEWILRSQGEMLRAAITNTFQTNYGDRAVQVGGDNTGNISTGDAAAEVVSLRQQLAEAREEIKKKDECIYKLINSRL